MKYLLVLFLKTLKITHLIVRTSIHVKLHMMMFATNGKLKTTSLLSLTTRGVLSGHQTVSGHLSNVLVLVKIMSTLVFTSL